ncbi:MAG: mechanosensitive ion channel family protein [Eubacteriales bacterium]|nr:mechanosensitive ion channel family protein [Eubacteriales bacterium]
MDNFFQSIIKVFQEATADTILNIAGTVILYFLIWQLSKKLLGFARNSLSRSKIDKGVVSFISSFLSIAVKIILIVSVLIKLGVPSTSFVTLLGSAGIAIGLALQGSLSNLAGGLMILVYQPFKVGHFIKSPDADSGTVTEIGIFYTKLLTPDNRVVVLPNGTLSNGNIINMSAMPIRRIDIPLTFPLNADVEKIKSILVNVAKSHPDTLEDPPLEARLSQIADGTMQFTLRVFAPQSKWWNAKHDLNETLMAEFRKENIAFAAPQIHISSEK